MEGKLSLVRRQAALSYIRQLIFLNGVDHRRNSEAHKDAEVLIDAAVRETAAEMKEADRRQEWLGRKYGNESID